MNDKLGNIFSYLFTRYIRFTFLCFLVMTTLMIFGAPFKKVLREDAYVYLLKGFEITEGDWVPIRSHSIGWSMLQAPFLKLFGIKSIFEGMTLSRILSILTMGFSIFPFAALSSKLMDSRAAIIAVLAFALYPNLIILGRSSYSEPLFFLLVISSAYFLADYQKKPVNLVIGTVLASLSFYTRPNGLFMLGVIVLYLIYLLWQKKINWALTILLPFLFFVVSLPHLYLRYEAFGAFFDYGINSQYLFTTNVIGSHNSHAKMIEDWGANSIGYFYQKLIIDGLLKLLTLFISLLGIIWLLPFSLGSVKYLIIARYPKFDLILILIFVFIACFAAVFQVYSAPRHLFILLPFVLIISSKFVVDIIGRVTKVNNILISCFIVLIILAQNPFPNVKKGIRLSTPKVRDEWAIWAADNLKGKIAIIEGGDLIAMQLPDTRIGGRDQFDLRAEQSGVSVFRPARYKNLKEAVRDFKELGVDYVLLDPKNIERRSYLREAYEPEWSKHFILVKSFKSKRGTRRRIKDVDVFKVAY